MVDTLFFPSSIAVIGASADISKVGYAVLRNILSHGYTGKVYPVNQKGTTILGRKTYRALKDIGEVVDLAIICIPAAFVAQILRDCVDIGIHAAIIISAGFKETGADGVRAENEIRDIVRASGIRVLGPNCLGVICTENDLNATFASGMLPKGRMSFFSQSGALGVAILDWAMGRNVGFSKFISLGNKADLSETDFIEYLSEDNGTDIILGYIEDVADGKRFMDIAPKITRKKPVVLIKSGGTLAGARAASSHTGGAAFRQTGVIRATGVDDLFTTASVFSCGRLPSGRNLLIVTNAGGPGILAADMAERMGITLPILDEATVGRLRKLLPGSASLGNPIDIIGDARSDRYRAVIREGLRSKIVDGIIVILTPQAMVDVENVAKVVVEESSGARKPVLACFMGQLSVRDAVKYLEQNRIPNFSYPEDSVKAFRTLSDHAAWRKRPASDLSVVRVKKSIVRKKLGEAKKLGSTRLIEDDAREILEACGFRFPMRGLATTRKEAVSLSKKIGFPVVMKISSPDIVHKTDVGGVRLDISSPAEAEEAFSDLTAKALHFMPHAHIQGVNVYEMVKGGKEVILGVTFDRTFDHMIMFGLGGIYVEVMKDVSFRVAPVSRTDAREMIREIKGYPLLQGVRGEKAVNIEMIVDAVMRLSQLVTDFPEIHELDINPYVMLADGAVALDSRIITALPGITGR